MKRFAAILAAFLLAAAMTGCCPDDKQESYTASKPVLYLYPETTTEVSVKLDYQGTLTTTYPAYNEQYVGQIGGTPPSGIKMSTPTGTHNE